MTSLPTVWQSLRARIFGETRIRSRGFQASLDGIRGIAIGLMAAAILVLRQPWPFSGRFLQEELVGLYQPTFARSPLELLLTPWNGFVDVVFRFAFELARITPLAPYLVLLATIALVAAFVASDRLANVIPSREVRILAALGLACLPFADGAYISVVNAHWFLGLYLAILLVAVRPTTTRGRVFDGVTVGIAALNGANAIILAPLYLLRWRGRPELVIPMIGAALVEVASLLTSQRHGYDATLVGAAAATVVRIGLAPIGDTLASIVVAVPVIAMTVVAVVLGAAAIGARAVDGWLLGAVGYLAVATPVLGLLGLQARDMLNVVEGERYVIAAAWLLLVIGLSAWRRGAGQILLAAFAVGLVTTAAIGPGRLYEPTPPPPGYVVPVGMQYGVWIYP